MDSLALLCNLYGDGPQTLRRLREAGCGTLASLESIESERLAALLRTSVRAAKRFQSEGRLLRERSEPPAERTSRARPRDEPEAQKAAAPNPLLTPVLVAWRERDARAGSVVLATGDTPTATLSRQTEDDTRVEGPSLAELEGMDADLSASLRAAGVASPHDLCNADVLDLAGRGVAGYTRLLRVQFLARRRLGAADERPAATVGVPVRPAAGARGPAAGVLDAADEERSAESELAAQATASASLPEPDVVIPHPPPERRRADRSPIGTRSDPVVRFSPRADLCPAPEPILQSELEQFARVRESAAETSSTLRAREEEGSSGPFA